MNGSLIKEPTDVEIVQCDQCIQKAKHRASFLAGPLYFCNHHFTVLNRNRTLEKSALEVITLTVSSK